MRNYLLLLTIGAAACLSPARVMKDLTSLEVLSAHASDAYNQCIARPVPVETAACKGFHMCIDLTAKTAQHGAKAIADAADKDPWMRGANSMAWSASLPIANQVCKAAGIKP